MLETDFAVVSWPDTSLVESPLVLPTVEYLLPDRKDDDRVRVWLAVHMPSNTAVAGLRLGLDSGASGSEVVGPSVVIHDVSVDPGWQRRGIATTLMINTQEWVATQPGLARTISLGVQIDNTQAIRLYKKLGYTIAALREQPIIIAGSNGKPCHIMYKNLDQPNTTVS